MAFNGLALVAFAQAYEMWVEPHGKLYAICVQGNLPICTRTSPKLHLRAVLLGSDAQLGLEWCTQR
jgi:hypothetical protein